MKILLHVNYFEGPGKLDRVFRLAYENGYDGIELRWKYRYDDLSQTQYQEKIAALKQQYPDLEIVFGGTVDYCRGEQADVQRDTEAYLAFLAWARANCGSRVMNFFTGAVIADDAGFLEFDRNGSGAATEEDYRRSADGLKVIGDAARELGILIALETHNGYVHDLAAPSRKLMEMTNHDAIGLNYDHGNIFINKNGESIDEVFDLLDGKIYYAHLKNIMTYNNVYLVTRLEEGHIDIMHVVDRLRGRLKSGMLAVEYPAPGDGIIAAKRDMEYMRFIRESLDI